MSAVMDLTNILNTKESTAGGVAYQTHTHADPRYHHQTSSSHYHYHQQQPRLYQDHHHHHHHHQAFFEHPQPRSPTTSIIDSEHVTSPSSEGSMSSQAYSMHSRPSVESIIAMTGNMTGAFTSTTTPQPLPDVPPYQSRMPDGFDKDKTPKIFPCSVCAKGFARRSDLARHERIHSGVRPHMCDHPGCNKQFIQRSALTVHARVHTGEKPHMCEACGKAFSDSSSLARHRRIHSGKRPYKCPYADCQKTFTRRTTLTRHQNHHTGTISEAAAATAAALAARPPQPRGRPSRSPSEIDPNIDSSLESASSLAPLDSMSPSQHQMPMDMSMHRPEYGLGSIWRGPADPNDYQQITPRPTPSTTPTMGQPHQHHQRIPSATSHPGHYMPQLPSLQTGHSRRSASPHASGGSPHVGSPHMSTASPSLMQQQWHNHQHMSYQQSPTAFYPQNSLSPRIQYS